MSLVTLRSTPYIYIYKYTAELNSFLHNPHTSNEAKNHARDVLDNEILGDQPREDLYAVRQRNKETHRVEGDLKG